MKIKVALAGNPNCGKTTIFNALTGARQYVGNWPGVTVERVNGFWKQDKEIEIVDLPGIYSLSPYSPEEVVSREFCLSEEVDAIVNVVDATNLERNLYLTSQLMDTGHPVIVVLNMMDLVSARGDSIDMDALSEELGCLVVGASALKNTGLVEVMEAAKAAAQSGQLPHTKKRYAPDVEAILDDIAEKIADTVPKNSRTWYATKLFENDFLSVEQLHLTDVLENELRIGADKVAAQFDDDAEAVIIDQRYQWVDKVIKKSLIKGEAKTTVTQRIDRIVTGRALGIPVFIAVMFLVYYISVSTVGSWGTNWANEGLFGDGWSLFGMWVPGIPTVIANIMGETAPAWATGLVLDGVVSGVGSVLGFVPQMAVLFLMLAFLEDVGYMSRIAFVLDRVFHRFGLSGRSFIPMMISSGCAVPGIMATKTIQNVNDRRMTTMLTSMIPCGAKLPIIALIFGAALGGAQAWWAAPVFYFMGVGAIIISGIMLKKTKIFAGDVTAFVLELPDYHWPAANGIFRAVWERVRSFIIKAGTIIFVASVLIWFLSSFGFGAQGFGLLDSNAPNYMDASLLAKFSGLFAFIFAPLGFGSWEAVAGTISGLIAKENVVATFAVITNMSGATEGSTTLWSATAGLFGGNIGAIWAFAAFNLLCAPCFAALGAIRDRMKSTKWFWIAVGYECGFAWVVGTIIYQLYMFFALGIFGFWTVVAFLLLAAMLFQLFRPMPGNKDKKIIAVPAAA